MKRLLVEGDKVKADLVKAAGAILSAAAVARILPASPESLRETYPDVQFANGDIAGVADEL